jgi:cytochrome P450
MSVSDFARPFTIAERPPAPIPHEKPLGSVSLLFRFWRNPLTTWTRFNFEAPITQANGVLGRVAVVCEPASIKRVLIDNAANYRKDALQLRVLSPGLGGGLLTAEGGDWRRQRRALAPLFTPRMIETFGPAMIAAADWLVGRWSPLRDGRRLDVAAEMSVATLEVLQRTILPEGLTRDPRDFANGMSDLVNSIGALHPFDVLDAPDWLPRVGKPSPKRALKFFDAATDDILARRRGRDGEPEAARPRDLLTMLLDARDPQTGEALSEDEIRSNVVTFIGAGHETTANALTWSLFLLSQHPAWREQVEAEVDDVLGNGSFDLNAIERLKRVRATLDETMRLYPPAPSLGREALAADMLAGQKIHPGTLVVISPYVVHRHKLLWRAPDHFDPTRFLPENRDKIDRFAYLPFGGGPRSCIGMGFALQEATIILAAIVRAFRLDLAPGWRVAPIQRLTLRPKGGMPMIVQHRRHKGEA